MADIVQVIRQVFARVPADRTDQAFNVLLFGFHAQKVACELFKRES